MRRKLISIVLVILFSLLASASIAEEDPVLIYVADLLQENVHLSNKLFNTYMNLDTNGSNTWFRVMLDWRTGNEGISAMCSYTQRSYELYPVDTLEKTRCLLSLLRHYEEISSMLPADVELTYRILEADGNKIDITLYNYKNYLKQYQVALGIE